MLVIKLNSRKIIKLNIISNELFTSANIIKKGKLINNFLTFFMSIKLNLFFYGLA
jgi:hypothetical protein